MTTNNIIVLCAFIAYMIIMIVIGFVCSKGNKNNEDYFLGGRNLGSWTAAMSAQASDMSGWLLMGLPGAVYLAGTGEAWIAVGLLIGTILNWYIVSARLRKYTIVAGNSLTIPSFFKNRYRDHKNIIKIVSASIIAVFFTVYTASAFSSGAKLFATLFSDSASGDENYNRVYVIGLIVAAVVILVYTFMGGFKAVCTTDLIQGLMMIVAILTVPVLAYAILTFDTSFSSALAAKGVEQPAQFLNFFVNGDGTPVSAVSIISNLAWGLGYFGMPHILLRFMAIENPDKVKVSRRVAEIWVVISMAVAVLIGVVGMAMIKEGALPEFKDSETVIVQIANLLSKIGVVPALLAGVILAGILASTMSTADSQLLAASSAASENIIGGLFRIKLSETAQMIVARVTLIAISVIGVVIAWDSNSSVFGIVSFAWAGFGAVFGPVMLLSLFWKRSNRYGALAGMIVGGVMVFVWKNAIAKLGGVFDIYELLPAFICGLLVNVIVSLLTPKPEKEITEVFDELKNSK